MLRHRHGNLTSAAEFYRPALQPFSLPLSDGPGARAGAHRRVRPVFTGGVIARIFVAMQADEGNAFVDAVVRPLGFCEKLHKPFRLLQRRAIKDKST